MSMEPVRSLPATDQSSPPASASVPSPAAPKETSALSMCDQLAEPSFKLNFVRID